MPRTGQDVIKEPAGAGRPDQAEEVANVGTGAGGTGLRCEPAARLV